jgi:uncharacterized integral membrane protein (TIGR00697 family)
MNIHNRIQSDSTNNSPRYFFLLSTFFTSFWLISLISAVKIVNFFGISLTGGFLTFPFTTMLSSLLVEVYGYKYARQAIWSGFCLCFTYIVFINIINIIPSSPNWELQKEFQSILVPQTRIFIASLIAFWFSGFVNNYLMAKLKCRGSSLTFRILIASFVSITIDINMFFLIGFLGALPFKLLSKIFTYAYIKKIICEILILPLIWKLIQSLKKIEGYDLYDTNTDFSPFLMDNVYDINSYRKLDLSSSKYTNIIKI